MALKRMGSNGSREMTVILGKKWEDLGVSIIQKWRLNQEKLVRGFCLSFAYLTPDCIDLKEICKRITVHWSIEKSSYLDFSWTLIAHTPSNESGWFEVVIGYFEIGAERDQVEWFRRDFHEEREG
jgi:hypothetical protein